MHQTTNINDAYMGSGKILNLAIKKYGIENFKREILFVFDNFEEMLLKEAELVTEEFCLRNDTYNLTNGGKGGWSYINRSGIVKFKGKTHSELTKLRISNKAKGRSSPFRGKRHDDDTKSTIGIKSKAWLTGRKRSEETKNKISETMKQKNNDISHFKRLHESIEYARSCKPSHLRNDTKTKISLSVKESWSKRIRPERDWVSIQNDLNQSIDRKIIYEKYCINKNILDHGFAKGYITRLKNT